MKKAVIQLEALTCPSCIQKIEGAMKQLDGIEQDTVNISFNSSKLKFNFDDEKQSIETVAQAIDKLGYEVLKQQVKDI